MGELGYFVQSMSGGSNFIPPRSYTTPMRGSLGAASGYPSIFPNIPGGGMGNALLQTAGYFMGPTLGIDPMILQARQVGPMEAAYGQQYRNQLNMGLQVQGGVQQQMIQNYLTSKYIGVMGRMPGEAEQRQLAQQAQGSVKSLNIAMQVAQATGFSDNAMLNGMFPQFNVFAGMQTMTGSRLMPVGGPAIQQFTSDLMTGRMPFGRGGRAEAFKYLSASGLLPARQADLLTPGSPQYTRAMTRMMPVINRYERLAAGLRGVYGQTKSVEDIIMAFNQTLGGSLAGLSPDMATKMANQLQATITSNRMNPQYVTGVAAQSAEAFRQMGLHPAGGYQAGLTAVEMGQQLVSGRGGRTFYGQRDADELAGIYNQRIAQGRASSFNTVYGGYVSLLESRARSMGIDTSKMNAAQIAQVVGVKGSSLDRLAAIASGKVSTADVNYFSIHNINKLAKDLVGTGVVDANTAKYAMEHTSRLGQEASLRHLKDTTLIGLQNVQTTDRLLRAPLTKIVGNDKFGKVMDLITSGGIDISNEKGSIERLGRLGLTYTQASSAYTAIRIRAEGDSRIGAMRGAEEFLGSGPAAQRAAARLEAGGRLAGAAGDLAATMGESGIIERGVNALTSRPGTGAKNTIADILGGYADPSSKEYKAFMNAVSAEGGALPVEVTNFDEADSKRAAYGSSNLTRGRKEVTKNEANTGADLGDEVENNDSITAAGIIGGW